MLYVCNRVGVNRAFKRKCAVLRELGRFRGALTDLSYKSAHRCRFVAGR